VWLCVSIAFQRAPRPSVSEAASRRGEAPLARAGARGTGGGQRVSVGRRGGGGGGGVGGAGTRAGSARARRRWSRLRRSARRSVARRWRCASERGRRRGGASGGDGGVGGTAAVADGSERLLAARSHPGAAACAGAAMGIAGTPRCTCGCGGGTWGLGDLARDGSAGRGCGGGTGEARRGRAPHGAVSRVFWGVLGANLARVFCRERAATGVWGWARVARRVQLAASERTAAGAPASVRSAQRPSGPCGRGGAWSVEWPLSLRLSCAPYAATSVAVLRGVGRPDSELPPPPFVGLARWAALLR
jgi:hypothetical protein